MEIKIKHLILAALLLPACQPAEHKDTEKEAGTSVPPADTPSYFKEVLQAHGGLEKWKKLGSLQYELTSNGNKETHLIDLKNRKDLVQADRYAIGYDGAQV